MRRFRSYFSKNNTIVKDSLLNSSQNPVTEIVYGGEKKTLSRFIFNIDFSPLREKIEQGEINPQNIVSHKLHMINTINKTPQYIGKNTYNSNIERANSFVLDLFEINEEWDEGSGYDLILDGVIDLKNLRKQPSNWEYRKTNKEWDTHGVYESGVTEVVVSQAFDVGNENIEMDITDYVDDVLELSANTETNGLGLKHIDDLEKIKTLKPQSVGFHTKYTNTFFEPYVETIIDDIITDDRFYFYQNRNNLLCFRLNNEIPPDDVQMLSVNVYDYLGNLFKTINGEEVLYLGDQTYGVELKVSSDNYPDAVMFNDEWIFKIDGREMKHTDRFYIASFKEHLFNYGDINLLNYHFYFWGITEKEKIEKGTIKRIKIVIKELYANSNALKPIDIEYRLFTKIDDRYEITIIPFTPVNRIKTTHEFLLDTSWLIPQDYIIELRVKNQYQKESKEKLSFTVI